MEEFVEIFIKNKCDEIPVGSAEYINKFLPFYANIPSDDLAFLFAYMHSSCNGLFEFMNDKLTVNHHFNADASRSMLSLIDLYRKLDKSLKNTKFDFELDNEYLETINLCKTFLRSSGGSTIPNDFKRIDIIEIRPIFQLLNPPQQTSRTTATQKQNTKDTAMKEGKSKVFIVHGHDNETKQEVARYIESIGLQAIILHEQASRSMTIIEKIEHYSNEASFAVVLYTPCDKGRGTNETTVHPRYRARQNVVFEHGYLMARIGRNNVMALVKGDIETPSDISGIVYTLLDEYGAWKQELARELKACEYKLVIE